MCWLTLILLMWRIWWAPNNASKCQMGFNLASKRLIKKWKCMGSYHGTSLKKWREIAKGQNKRTVKQYSWRIRDQLDVTIFIKSQVLFHFFYAQHVSDINTSIIRSLRLSYCITTLVVCSCFDVCWSFGVAGWGGIRVAGWSTPTLQHTSKQEHMTNVVIQ